MVLAVAMLSVSALAGCDGEGVLASGIFETAESSIKFPAGQDTNIDSLEVGNDKALAYGSIFMKTPKATAVNNLEIKKNQDSGACANGVGPNGCCMNQLASTEQTQGKTASLSTSDCTDCCIKVNVDQIKVGNRDALAFGFAAAENNVKIVANQR
ncbi:MAG TPA: hypothetical protein PLW21_04485 [Methanothrix sp.]|nr:hypothetical protein [Methanothrix sp.]